MTNNYYEVLGIEPTQNINLIHQAYIKAKNTYNDENPALYSLISKEECNEQLQRIEEAYSILGSNEKKHQYDQARGIVILKTQNTPEAFSLSENYIHQTNSKSGNSSTSKVQAKNKFALSYKEDSDFEDLILGAENFDGSFLKQIREYKNVSIERMSELTRVSKTYLRYIEEDRFEDLPAKVYTRGFVYQYAKCLKLNPELVSKSYMSRQDS